MASDSSLVGSKGKDAAKSLPTNTDKEERLLADLFFDDGSLIGLLPMELPPRPGRPNSTSARLRSRHARKMEVWREVCKLVLVLNGLDRGSTNQSRLMASRATQAKSVADQMKVTTAVSLAQQRLLGAAASLVRARRGRRPQGALGSNFYATQCPHRRTWLHKNYWH